MPSAVPPTATSTAGTAAPTASASPTPAASVDNAAVYASVESDVEALRGLRPTTAVDPKVVDPAGMAKVIDDAVDRSTSDAEWAANDRVLKALGFLAPDHSLRSLYLQLLASQVAGLYDPDAKTLYVLSKVGTLGPVERVTFAHEFTHALQDQNFGLQKLQTDVVGQSDQSLAHLSVAEGDATLVMSLWAQQHLSPGDLLQMVAASNDPEQTKVLNEMPSVLREGLLFPYTAGVAFVSARYASGGWAAVNDLYAKPPASTEQVLHPELYASGEPVRPVPVPNDLAKRLGSGWSVPYSDSLGELDLRVWLRDVGHVASAAADAAAAGWGGDRVLLASGPKGSWAVAVLTRWDTTADAAAFSTAATTTMSTLGGAKATIDAGSTDRVSLFVGSDDAAVSRLAGALGLAG